jgi:hypothetical protein
MTALFNRVRVLPGYSIKHDKMKIKHQINTLGVAVLSLAAVNGLAAEGQQNKSQIGNTIGLATAEPKDAWQFDATLPLWAAGIDGNVTVNGVRQNVNISFDQLKEHLDAAFGLELQAHKGKLGLFSGMDYLKLSGAGGVGAGGGLSSELKFLIVDGGVSYELVRTGEQHPFLLEATAGVRYWWASNDSTVKGPGGVFSYTHGGQKDLVDPMIGLRGSQFFTRKLHLDFAGDIGGFGISDNQATLDWSATGLLSYDFAKCFTISGGYRAVALDFSTGSGVNQNGMNIILNGILLTAQFKF